MYKATRSRIARTAAGATVGLALAGALAACSSSGPSSAGTSGGGSAGSSAQYTQADIQAALQKPTTLTMWGWAPQNQELVTAFEKQYPKIKINLVNAGTGTTEYTKIQNAVKAGSGAPDITQIEYAALPQFALPGDLLNLSDYGMDSLKSQFSSAVWDSVDLNGQLIGLPQDTGPMALFYNKTVFDKYHLTVPTTWAQYLADAEKLHAANPKEYITSDTGDAGFTTSMMWAAGGHPYEVSGTKNVTVSLTDPGMTEFENLWSQMISKGLLSSVPGWTSQWYSAMADGQVASLVTGGWMGVDLETGVPSGKGQWAVAPMPQWSSSGTPVTAENGGSADVVLASSQHKLAAAGFVQWFTTGKGEQLSAASGDFPASNTVLDSPTWQNQSWAYFGGQKINQVLAKSSEEVRPGWSYLPYQMYANSIFADSVGQAYTGKTTLAAGIKAWQQQVASYGTQQGFNVTLK